MLLSPDEPMKVQQQNKLERLKKRALRDGKCVVVNDGAHSIDGVTAFSLHHLLPLRVVMSLFLVIDG